MMDVNATNQAGGTLEQNEPTLERPQVLIGFLTGK
jgi:hypothetical protein